MSEKKRTIMLGFHSPVDGRLMREWLTDLGYEFVESIDDTAGIDLVLMDSLTARRLMDKAFGLKREAKYFLPVLVCINRGEDAGRWLKTGFDDVLRLPATKDVWRARIEIMLRLRHQSEELGQKSEFLHRALIESSGDHIFLLDANGAFVTSNDRVAHFDLDYGDQLKGRTIEQVYPKEVAAVYREQFQRVLTEGKTVVFEHALPSNRTTHYHLDTLYPIKFPDGTVMVGGICRDITERKLAEENLKKNEQFLNDIFNSVQDGISVLNLDLTVRHVNEIMNKWYKENLPLEGKKCYEAYHNADKPCNPCPTLRCFESGNTEWDIVPGPPKDSPVKWIELFSYPIKEPDSDKVTGVIEFVRDITERKLADEEARRAMREWEEIFQAIGHPTLILSPQHKVLAANKAALKAMGMTVEEIEGKPCYEVFHGTSSPPPGCPMEMMMRSGRLETVQMEIETLCGTFLVSCTPVFNARGELEKVIHIATDVTDRVRAEEDRWVLETAINNAQECIMVSDRENRLTYVNRAFEKLTGYSAAEALGNSPGMLKSGQHDRAYYQNLKQTIYAGHPWQGTLTLKKKNGELYDVSATITPVYGKAGIPDYFVSIHRDVTRERELEQRIQQNQRLEAIGTLAGGIAHDFNNLLSPILGFTELSMDALPTGSEVKENLEEVMRAARRATDLVRQILSFSRRSNHKRKPLQMAPIIKEALKLLRASIPVSIDIRQEITDTAESVIADPTEIHQVVMNLCTNAFHAMPDGGILTVALKSVELDSNDSALIPDCAPGRYLKLSVEDTGCGIPPEIRNKIFEPYFTTKKEGRGTGLGLAVTHSIVSACGGTINVYSEPGKGTRFSLYFPVAGDRPAEEVEKSAITARGHERILFIDDDATIVDLGKKMLERSGYSVTTSMDPVQALEQFEKAPHDFDMVITDMTMPGMTGDILAAAMLKIRPDLPIIICTGFSERMNKEKAQKMGIRRLIEKPVSPSKLLAAIREIFDQRLPNKSFTTV